MFALVYTPITDTYISTLYVPAGNWGKFLHVANLKENAF